jgi:hypothetical protein
MTQRHAHDRIARLGLEPRCQQGQGFLGAAFGLEHARAQDQHGRLVRCLLDQRRERFRGLGHALAAQQEVAQAQARLAAARAEREGLAVAALRAAEFADQLAGAPQLDVHPGRDRRRRHGGLQHGDRLRAATQVVQDPRVEEPDLRLTGRLLEGPAQVIVRSAQLARGMGLPRQRQEAGGGVESGRHLFLEGSEAQEADREELLEHVQWGAGPDTGSDSAGGPGSIRSRARNTPSTEVQVWQSSCRLPPDRPWRPAEGRTDHDGGRRYAAATRIPVGADRSRVARGNAPPRHRVHLRRSAQSRRGRCPGRTGPSAQHVLPGLAPDPRAAKCLGTASPLQMSAHHRGVGCAPGPLALPSISSKKATTWSRSSSASCL